jgi:arginine utilization protein RocB
LPCCVSKLTTDRSSSQFLHRRHTHTRKQQHARIIDTHNKMSSTGVEPKRYDVEVEQLKEKDTLHSEILVNKDLMTDAFQGEDSEHEQTVWQAVVSHKMACFWAFGMCFTM